VGSAASRKLRNVTTFSLVNGNETVPIAVKDGDQSDQTIIINEAFVSDCGNAQGDKNSSSNTGQHKSEVIIKESTLDGETSVDGDNEKKTVSRSAKTTNTVCEDNSEAILHWTKIATRIVAMTVGLINFGYMIEGTLYAIIMSENFGWSATEAGAGQMAGDFGGAVILFTLASKRGTSSCTRIPTILRMPLNNGILIVMLGVTLLMLSSSSLVIAAIAQLAMGALYIMSLQIGTEMAVLYGFGNPRALDHHISTNYIAFDGGLMIAAAIALPLYEAFDERVPLIGGGLMMIFGALLWILFFLRRGAARLEKEQSWLDFELASFNETVDVERSPSPESEPAVTSEEALNYTPFAHFVGFSML